MPRNCPSDPSTKKTIICIYIKAIKHPVQGSLLASGESEKSSSLFEFIHTFNWISRGRFRDLIERGMRTDKSRDICFFLPFNANPVTNNSWAGLCLDDCPETPWNSSTNLRYSPTGLDRTPGVSAICTHSSLPILFRHACLTSVNQTFRNETGLWIINRRTIPSYLQILLPLWLMSLPTDKYDNQRVSNYVRVLTLTLCIERAVFSIVVRRIRVGNMHYTAKKYGDF